LQYVSNNTSSHRVGSRVFWDKTATASSWRLTEAIFLLPLLLLAPSPSPSSQREVGVSREVLCVFRCLPEQVPGVHCTLPTQAGTRKVPVCRFPYQQTHESLKNITPLLLETESKGKAPGLDPALKHRNPGAMLAHKRNLPHIPPISWGFSSCYLINIYISQFSSYHFITKGFARW